MSELDEATRSDETMREIANEMMRETLKSVAAIADDALADEPHELDQCWEHLRSALGDIKKEVQPDAAWSQPQGDSPAEAQSRRDEKPWKPLEIPECGIDFQRYSSKDCEVYICAWQSGDGSISHVYEVRYRKVEDGKWSATLSNDGRKLCALSAPSRQLAYRCALGAMRNYLRRGHRKTLRSAKEGSAA